MDRCITDCGVVDVYVNYEDDVDEAWQNMFSSGTNKEAHNCIISQDNIVPAHYTNRNFTQIFGTNSVHTK